MRKSGDPEELKFRAPSKPAAIEKNLNGDLVFLPGFNGIPVRGAPNRIIEPEELKKYVACWDIHFRIFDLEDSEDLAKYETLMTAAGSNIWVRVLKEEWPDRLEDGRWRVAVKWGESFMQPRQTGVFKSTRSPLDGA